MQATPDKPFDNLLPIQAWADRILTCDHLTLQIAFVDGLRLDRRQTALITGANLALALIGRAYSTKRIYQLVTSIEWQEMVGSFAIRANFEPVLWALINRTTDYSAICAVARLLADQRCLDQDELEKVFLLLYEQTANRWAKGSAVSYLLSYGRIDLETAVRTFLELAEAEDRNMYVKESAAHEAAKLGATQEASRIMREIIMRPDPDSAPKSRAFQHLSELLAPDRGQSQTAYRIVQPTAGYPSL